MFKQVYSRWCVLNKESNPTTCVLALPGRDQNGFWMAQNYNNEDLQETLIVGVTPHFYEWYPQPNGAKDQERAIAGLPAALDAIDSILMQIDKHFGIPPQKVALAGFSAGGVMAVHAGIHLPYHFPAVFCHSGTILEPHKVPPCSKSNTAFFLFHSKDDKCFTWEERYLPMKYALSDAEYLTQVIERKNVGHSLHQKDSEIGSEIASQILNQIK